MKKEGIKRKVSIVKWVDVEIKCLLNTHSKHFREEKDIEGDNIFVVPTRRSASKKATQINSW